MEAVALLPGGRSSFLIRAGRDESGVHVDDQPARQRLARDGEPGEPGGRPLDEVPGVLSRLRPRPGDPVQHARGSGQVERTADRRAAGSGSQDRGQVREQGDVAHARGAERDRDGQRDEHRPAVEQRRRALLQQGGGQPGGKAELVGCLAEQDRASVADEALSVRGDLQGTVPPVKLHGEERSRAEDCMVVVTRNLPGPGRSSPSNTERGDGRCAGRPLFHVISGCLIAQHP